VIDQSQGLQIVNLLSGNKKFYHGFKQKTNRSMSQKKSKNYKLVAGAGAVLALGMSIFYFFYAHEGEMWERYLPSALFLLVAIVAFIRYRKL